MALPLLSHPGPDNALAFFDAKQQVSIRGELS